MQFKEYLGRAEELKALLNGQQPVTATPAGAAAQKARGGKPNGGGGEGGGGDVCLIASIPFHAPVLPSTCVHRHAGLIASALARVCPENLVHTNISVALELMRILDVVCSQVMLRRISFEHHWAVPYLPSGQMSR